MTRIKSIGERGSPWRSPLLCWMKSPGIPSSSTWVEEDANRPHRMSRHLEPKPILSRTSRRNGQDTESKALVMSSLSSNLGCFWECKNLVVCWTNIKLSCMNRFLNKSTLIGRDHLIKVTCQSVCKNFSHQLSETVNQTNGPEILHLISLCLLWD
jgi:hypothetical protein